MTDTMHPVERRRWWPIEHADEYMPAGRLTPDEWLCRSDDGGHAFAGWPELDVDSVRLAEGEIVEFIGRDSLGTSHLSFDDEGRPRWAPAVPVTANYFWDGDEIIADTPEEFVEFLCDVDPIPDPVTVTLSDWSHTLRCRFTAENGPPRFVPLDPIPADPADAVTASVMDDAHGDLLTQSQPIGDQS